MFSALKRSVKQSLQAIGVPHPIISFFGGVVNMLRTAKQAITKKLIALGVRPEYLKVFSTSKKYSHFDEELLLKKYDLSIPEQNKTPYVIDIAASDGVSMSNTYALYLSGLPGLAVELDDTKFRQLSRTYKRFTQVQLLKTMITPDNIISVFQRYKVPENFSILNLDIDGYDYFVLDALLAHYRPTLICAEINEKIPPPLKFTVLYDPAYSWHTNHFFGQSISQLYGLCTKYGYDLVELHYNNAFLIPHEINRNTSLTPEVAYAEGYRNKKDRKERFPYNADIDPVLEMNADDAKRFIEDAFQRYRGQFLLS